MNAQAKIIEADAVDASTELTVIPRETALSVLTDTEQFDAFYLRVKAVVDAHVPDISTAKGREAIKALAFKVVKSKTAIDAAGKLLTEEWRSQTSKVDAARKAIRDKLDVLRDEARRPVTEWEEAEDKRVEAVKATMAQLQAAAVITVNDTSDSLDARLAEVQAVQILDDQFQEYAAAARSHRDAAVEALAAGIERLAKEEADRAELQRLRDQQAERERVEQAALEERQRAEAAATAARIEAEAAERRRADEAARVQREQEARERAAAEAARAAQAEAERRAQEALDAAEAAHRAEVARLQREADQERQARETEARDTQAKRDREEAAAAAQRQADEARAADRAHRSTVMGAAKAAIMAAGGVGEEAAKKIVLAIGAGEIPAVSLKF